MQYLKINKSTTLSDLSNIFGSNLESFLHVNDAPRVPNVGAQYMKRCADIIASTSDVSASRKISVLSTMTSDTDIFQTAALTDDYGWRLLSARDILPGTMRIPDTSPIPSSNSTYGDGNPVPQDIFEAVAKSIKSHNQVDPSIFNEVAYALPTNIHDVGGGGRSGSDPMQWFHIPWGEVTLHSSLDDSRIDFPVYPEDLSDGRKANYTNMPDLLFQYEPWQIYTSSGPRTQTFSFHFHRDIWTGDHRDGKANELIRACEANCYPRYRGSAVETSIVTLYIHGNAMIRGILTDVNVNWSGPIGLDGFYLECKMDISITEVSSEQLNFDVIKNKPLIG